ncbi:hypothetical protein G3O06_26730 [Burkholderia sp. Ac-20345]|uniref:hypothetical protein n=1 Tax=Burkholderia sp. Ac-20345 TaxID=2703891 RepID=UPI00197BDF10|nr:hypothetical protein [Burkholderia sp. Ac-20345]MBN3781111.1 hypothetical protein [Burkholderia sp. Ac-20345]
MKMPIENLLVKTIAIVSITSFLTACGGNDSSGPTPGGSSPAVTNTIKSGIFTSWTQGSINATINIPGTGTTTVGVTAASASPFWTGSNLMVLGSNASTNTATYLTSPDGINWAAQYTTLPNPLGSGYSMQVLNMTSDGNGNIAAYGVDIATSGSPATGQVFVAFADASTMTWQVSLLNVQQSVLPSVAVTGGSPGREYGISYAYGRWYLGYQPYGSAVTYVESTNRGSSWQPSGAGSLVFLSNFKKDNLYRSAKATSPDLTAWTTYQPSVNGTNYFQVTSTAISNSKAIVFSPAGNQAVANGGLTGIKTVVSVDGKTWSAGDINSNATAAFTCNDRLFMLTSSYPAAATSYASDDGINWTQGTLPALNAGTNESYLTGACLPVAARAVVFTSGTSGNRVFYSG